MSLFLKIFLWFLLAMAIVVGVSVFVSWSTQGEPLAERWRNNSRNAVTVYAETAKHIYDIDGGIEVNNFLKIISENFENRFVCVANNPETDCFNGRFGNDPRALIKKAFQSDEVVFDQIKFEENYSARRFTTKDGKNFVFVMRSEFPRPPMPFGMDWTTRIVRILSILLTAGLVCYGLALYLVKPILSLREATQQLAGGDFKTRIDSKRRDELGQLARDFDDMAERIESLLASQQRLTRDISHELRSPLARMNVALELVKSKTDEQANPLIRRIETESQRLNEMISNILTLSKLESRSETIEKSELNLTKLLESVVTDANFEAQAKGKSVEIVNTDSVTLIGNERLLRSAVENVVRNAVRYTNSRVETSIAKSGNEISITVRNYGDGIPEKDLKEIFRPFYRVSEARERSSGGIGLGLAITEQAVHGHGGEVSARNTEDGVVVEIKLPLSGGHL